MCVQTQTVVTPFIGDMTANFTSSKPWLPTAEAYVTVEGACFPVSRAG